MGKPSKNTLYNIIQVCNILLSIIILCFNYVLLAETVFKHVTLKLYFRQLTLKLIELFPTFELLI